MEEKKEAFEQDRDLGDESDGPKQVKKRLHRPLVDEKTYRADLARRKLELLRRRIGA